MLEMAFSQSSSALTKNVRHVSKYTNNFDITKGLEHFPIYLSETMVDVKYADFEYVRSSVPGPGCDMEAFQSQLIGCDCRTDSCDLTCLCVARYRNSYTNHKLIEDFVKKPIIECNMDCKCSNNCDNRLVQNGIRFKLEVFKSQGKGLGLKNLEMIPKLSFVCEYAGEILSYETALERVKMLKKEDMNYIFVLNEHCANGVNKTYIDPTFSGNVGRFINHSCEPNLVMVPVRIDKVIPKICLFAIRDIAKNEELSYDYSGMSQAEVSDEQKESILLESKDEARKPCLCFSNGCKGYLPCDDSLFD